MDMVQHIVPLLIQMQAQMPDQNSTPFPVTILVFIGMLIVLVFFHELGHFLTAIWLGIRVEEFGFGFPPRITTLFEYKGVAYTINWLPLGGFVRFGGEENTLYGTGSLAEAPPWRKIAVLFAGPLMNLLLAVVIFAVMFTFDGIPNPIGQHISEVYTDSPAARAGFRPDDIILSLGGQRVNEINAVGNIASRHGGESIEAVILRDGQQQTLTVIPGPWTGPDGEARSVGLGLAYSAEIEKIHTNPVQATLAGIGHTGDVLVAMISGLGQLIGGLFGVNEPPPGGVAGPVGIARATGEVIDAGGLLAFWRWMALISLNLFVINLLPIPALDGSHIVFSVVEWLRGGKKVPPEKEALVHAIGFVALMGLIVVISVSDVLKAINGAPAIGQ